MYHDLDLVFFTSAQGQFGEITEHGEVVVIGISSENQDLYGVRLGMTLSLIHILCINTPVCQLF